MEIQIEVCEEVLTRLHGCAASVVNSDKCRRQRKMIYLKKAFTIFHE